MSCAPKQEATYQNLNAVAFAKLLNESTDAVVLDVRTMREYRLGHLKNSTLIDFYLKDFNDKLEKLDKSKSYFVYCHVGVRSEEAAKRLQARGFTKVYNLQGGILDWRKAGFKLER